MANKMLIDATHPEETRVVVLRGNRVEEFDFETAHRKQLRGNIYLAKVTRVEPSLQAAFVEYGGNRHGFLAFSEIHPDYYQIPVADRQALIDADARAARDDDEADDHPRGGRRGPAAATATASVPTPAATKPFQSDPLAADEMAHEAAEIPAGENVTGESSPDDTHVEPISRPSAPMRAAATEIAHQNEDHARRAAAGRRDRKSAGPGRDRHSGRAPREADHEHEAHASEHDGRGACRRRARRRIMPPAEGGERPATAETADGQERPRTRPRRRGRDRRIRRRLRRDGRGRRARTALSPPIQDPGGHQAPAGHAGAGGQGRARHQGRGADDLSVARRPLLRADAQHRARRRHQPQDHQRRRPQEASRDRRGARGSGGHGRHPAHRRRRPHQGRGQARLRISAADLGAGPRPDA